MPCFFLELAVSCFWWEDIWLQKKICRNEKLQLKGSLKKNGFDRWRLVTNAVSSVSGEEKTFFIEFYAVNPALSSKECVLGFKNRFNKSTEDFQYVLPGSETAKKFHFSNLCFAFIFYDKSRSSFCKRKPDEFLFSA